jgi:hypothetical protein
MMKKFVIGMMVVSAASAQAQQITGSRQGSQQGLKASGLGINYSLVGPVLVSVGGSMILAGAAAEGVKASVGASEVSAELATAAKKMFFEALENTSDIVMTNLEIVGDKVYMTYKIRVEPKLVEAGQKVETAAQELTFTIVVNYGKAKDALAAVGQDIKDLGQSIKSGAAASVRLVKHSAGASAQAAGYSITYGAAVSATIGVILTEEGESLLGNKTRK